MKIRIIIFILMAFLLSCSLNQNKDKNRKPHLTEDISVSYIEENIKKCKPRMILTKEGVDLVKQKRSRDTLSSHVYTLIKSDASKLLKEEVLTRNQIGIRLLGTSRDFLYRVNVFSAVWIFEQDSAYLERLNKEILTICNFKDWNPSHFLDVGEMLMGLSLAIDWNYKDLPDSTIKIAKKAIIEKGLRPGMDTAKEYNWWHNTEHNWNQVCFGGLIAGAIAIFEDDPELSTKVLNFGLKKLPDALKAYSPEGVYPEGASYWAYGTSYSILTISLLETSLGTDFGIKEYLGFMDSPVAILKSITPAGRFYNFSDCGDYCGSSPYFILSWFAKETGISEYLNKEVLMQPVEKMKNMPRVITPALLWISEFEKKERTTLPDNWYGKGKNPVVVFSEENGYYFACKGGSASINHGNMDAGSFILEIDSVLWSLDPGNQNYNKLEQRGFKLWEKCQECERWTLLSKNNFGHSTLTINNSLHKADARAEITDFVDSDTAMVAIDMTSLYGKNVDNAIRRFKKPDDKSLIIEDQIITNDFTKSITWQLITTAEVKPEKGGAVLSQKGKELSLKIISSPDMELKIKSLDPPPLELDKKIKGLKRLELYLGQNNIKKDTKIIVGLFSRE